MKERDEHETRWRGNTMNVSAAQTLHRGFVRGAMDVLQSMGGAPFTVQADPPLPLDQQAIETLFREYPVCLRARVAGDIGGVAMMFSPAVAARVADLVGGGDVTASRAYTEADRAMLLELADPMLGGGVTSLMQEFGRPVVQLQDIAVDDTGKGTADLMSAMDFEATWSRFTFSAEGFPESEGVSVVSVTMEDLVPGATRPQEKQRMLSESEMKDILGGGFETHSPATAQNLERILDIRLMAQVRLGRVLMPLGQILNLGPGSIIDVGHLVDEPVELLVNDKLIARGDVVVVDEKFGLRITEIVSPRERIESLR